MAIAKPWLLALLVLAGFAAQAADPVTIPLDELPSESVTPALDSPRAVERRILSFRGRWTLDAGTGWLLDEPFYQNEFFGLRAMYNWNEVSGFGLRYMSWARGLSDYGSQLLQNNNLNFNYGRGPERGYALTYENRFIYGKLSVGKNNILPMTTQGQFDAGLIQYGARSLPFVSAGIGNKVFFTPHLGLDLTVKVLWRQALDPLSEDLHAATPPSESAFSVKSRFSTGLDLSLVYLF